MINPHWSYCALWKVSDSVTQCYSQLWPHLYPTSFTSSQSVHRGWSKWMKTTTRGTSSSKQETLRRRRMQNISLKARSHCHLQSSGAVCHPDTLALPGFMITSIPVISPDPSNLIWILPAPPPVHKNAMAPGRCELFSLSTEAVLSARWRVC